MPYEERNEFRYKVTLDTARARNAGLQLYQDLGKIFSETSMKVNSDSITKANKEVIRLQQNLTAALNPIKGTIDLAMFDTQMAKSGKDLVSYAQSLSKYGRDGADAYLSLTKAISSAEAPSSRLNENLHKAGEQLKRTIGWQVSSSAIHGVMSTYNQAIGYAKELNRSLTDIRIVTGQSSAQMAQFAKTANAAAKELSSTTTRYTDAALIYYQQGLNEKAVKERADITVKMANVAGVSAEKASQQLTAIWNNFDNGSKSLEHYADVLVKLGAETASSTDEISKGVQKFAAIGNTVGLSYEYAASALATVTATPRESADTVGTSFRTLFSRLQGLSLGETLEDGTTLNKYSKALNTIGVRIKETNGDMKSMNDILDEIGAKWGSLNKDTQIGLAQSIGGARQYSTFMALMDNWEYFQENVDRANNASGALQAQQEIYADSWEAASKRVQTSMEKIFDSVIDDQIIIGMTDVFSGALNGLNGLINGFGGLGGIMGSVSSIFMSKYAKEMPRVLQELKYNLDYMMNGKTQAISNKQNNVFKQAEQGLGVFAKTNQMSPVYGKDSRGQDVITSYTGGDDLVLAQQINNAKASMERRKEYLAIENTLSEEEKESYQQRLSILDMWDNNVVQQAKKAQEQKEILTTEREAAAATDYDNMVNKANATRGEEYAKFLQDSESDRQLYKDYKKDYQIDGFDLTTEEGRKAYTDKVNADYEASLFKKDGTQQRAINGSRPEDKRRQRDAKLEIVREAQELGEIIIDPDANFKHSAAQMTEAQQQYYQQLKESGKINANIAANYESALQKIGNGDALYHTERMAVKDVLMSFQEPVIQAAEGLGGVNSSLERFDRALTATGKITQDTGDSIKKSLGKDLKDSISSVDREYKAQLETIGKFDPETNKFILDQKYADSTKINQEQIDQTLKTLGALTDANNFDENGTYIGKEKIDLTTFTEEMQKQSNAILNAAEEKAPVKISSEVISEAMEKGSRDFDLKESNVQRQKEFDEAAIEHEIKKSEQIMQTASTIVAATSAMQASMSTYQTLSNENATGFEKMMAVTGNLTSGLMLAGSMKELGASLGGTIGGALAGPYGMIASAALSILPGVVQYIGDNIENDDEAAARIEQDAVNAQARADGSVQQQQNLENSIEQYNSITEKVLTTQEGTLEHSKAINQANVQAYDLISQYGLTSDDYTRNDDTGLIEINNSTLDRIEAGVNTDAINNINRVFAADAVNAFNSYRTTEDYFKEKVKEKDMSFDLDNPDNFTEQYGENGEPIRVQNYTSYEDVYRDRYASSDKELYSLKAEAEKTGLLAEMKYNDALQAAAGANGKISDEEKNAIAFLTANLDAAEEKKRTDRIEAEYGGDASTWGSNGYKAVEDAKEILGEEYDRLIATDEFKALDEVSQRQELMNRTKAQVLLNEYSKEIDAKVKEIGKIDKLFTDVKDVSMQELSARIAYGNREDASESDKLGAQYAEAQYNKTFLDLGKAIDAYTTEGLKSTDVTSLINSLTVDQANILGQTLQSAGDLFGTDASQSIYDAVTKAEGQDRRSLITALQKTNFDDGAIQALADLKDELGNIGDKELFEQVKSDFGGDKGIFSELLKDDSIGKVVEKFQQLGEINASDILEAAHNSADLASGLELANFNAAGFADALEAVSSGTISQDQISNPLLDVLSDMGGVESNIAEAYDSLDNFELDRSITTLGKGYGKVAKQMNQSLKQGIYLDDPLLQGWEKFFGKDSMENYVAKITEWNKNGGVSKKDFDAEFGDEIKTLYQIQKTGNLLPVWMQALDDAERRQTITKEKDGTTTYTTGGPEEKERDAGADGKEGTDDDKVVTWADYYKEQRDKYEEGSAEWNALNAAYNNQVKEDTASQDFGQKYIVQDGIVYNANYDESTGKSTIAQTEGENGKMVDDALFGYDPTTGKISTFAPDGVALEDSNFAKQFDTFEKFEEVMKNIIPDEGMRQAAIADWTERNPGVTQLWEDNGASGAFFKEYFGEAATDEDKEKLITREELEVIFNNSKDLQGKYGQLDAWIAEGLMGSETYGKEFKERYMNFGDVKVKGSSYAELAEGYKQANGKDTNLAKTIADKAGVTRTWNSETGWQAYTNIDDVNDVTAGLGFSQEAQTEVLNELLAQGTALVATVTDIDGNTKTISTNSAEYQQWLETSRAGEEATAENFQEFIDGQNSQSDQLKDMVEQQRAQLEYEKAVASGAFDEKTGVWDQEKWNQLKANEEKYGNSQVNEETGELEFVDADGTIRDAQGNVIKEAPANDGGGGDDVSPGRQPPSDNGDDGGGDEKKGGLGEVINKVVGGVSNAVNNFKEGYNNAREEGKGIIGSAASGIANAWNNSSVGQAVNNAVSSAVNTAKEVASNIWNKITGKAVGQNQHRVKKAYSSGKRNDGYEGLARVGEEGQELRVKKNGETELLGTKGETYAYVEKDDIIFTADQTEDILRNTPNLKNVPGFLIGQNNSLPAGVHATSSGYGNIWDSGKSGGSSGGAGGAEEDDWEPDRYVVIMEQLQDLQREYERLNKAKERAYGADKIKALDAEIAKTNELLKAQQQYISEIEQYREKDLQKMKDLGIDVDKEMIFDRNGVIRNFDEIEEKYKKAAEEGDQEAAKKFEAIQKFVETNNLLQEASDALIDIQWQLLDQAIERISTKVDIKLAVDDTELSYLSYQLGKINEEAYDVAKALDLVGQQMSTTMHKINPLRQGIEETLMKGLEGTDLTEEAKNALAKSIMDGTITAEQLEEMALDENISASVMENILNYREQILGLNTSLDQLRQQVVNLTEKHFTKFNQKMKNQDALLGHYEKSLMNYYKLVELLDRKFNGPMNQILTKINDNLQKNARDSIRSAELAVKAAEAEYATMKENYEKAIVSGDQDMVEKWKDQMEDAYGKLQATNASFAQKLLSANELFLSQFKAGIKMAVDDFQSQLSPLYNSVEAMSSAFERQNKINDLYVDDYEKYYELNKLTRDLQNSIDETDNINTKKALSKLQDEINKEKALENKLSEHDLEVLKNKVELEKARLALDEAKNAKSTVTLSRDQNGNWGYIYTAEEDKVSQAEQDYEDKLYQYQEANAKYINELQEMLVEAENDMVNAILELDPNDPGYQASLKSIYDTYDQIVNYVNSQLGDTFLSQEDSRIAALDAYGLSMINLKNDFADLSLSMVTGQKNLESYFNTLEVSLPKLLAQLNELEKTYDANIKDVNDYVSGNSTLAEYINADIDAIADKAETVNTTMQELYSTMTTDLSKINDEIAEIYDKYIGPINEMVQANEKLAESLHKVQEKLSDLSDVETPPILEEDKFDHPEGYTENDYGVIKKLTEDEMKLREEVKKEIQANDKGVITNYDALKEQWYREPPAEGKEDTRDEKLIAKWDLLQKLIDFGVYSIPDTAKILETASAVINSNAAAMESAAVATAATVNTDTGATIEQNVTIYAEFPEATDQNEIAAAFENMTNDAAQYANRTS